MLRGDKEAGKGREVRISRVQWMIYANNKA